MKSFKDFVKSDGQILDNINENSKRSFDRVTPADSKGQKTIVYKYEDGREAYPVDFYPSQIDEKQLLRAVRKILG